MNRIASILIATTMAVLIGVAPAHADTGGRNPDGTPCANTDAACLLVENADLRARFNELASGAFALRQDFNAATALNRSLGVRVGDAEATANQWRVRHGVLASRFTKLHARFVQRGERIDMLRARVADLRDRLNR